MTQNNGSRMSIGKMIEKVKVLLGVTTEPSYKADYTPLDSEGNIVRYKIGDYWGSFKEEDLEDYIALGCTN